MNLKRTMCAILAASMLTTGIVLTQSTATASAQTTTTPVSAASTASMPTTGAAANIVDGNILHCFDWKYNDIAAEMPSIAAAGFTAIQTSPAQPDGQDVWWWLYQPTGFYVGNNGLGSKEDLQNMINTAKQYNIKVIVDVVANHLRGDGTGVADNMNRNNHGDYWHENIGGAKDGDRYSVTHGDIGMADINSEHSEVQQIVLGYTNELKDMGVAGIRWDAAKHIGLPSEGCEFWKVVTSQGMYHYGEILNNPGVFGDAAKNAYREYTQYIGVTDSQYGMDTRNDIGSGKCIAGYANLGSETDTNLPANKLVYWAESHDNWCNNDDWGYSWWASQEQIDRAYAIVATRNGIPALYFSRPSSTRKDDIKIGQKGSTAFQSKAVSEVNKFKNVMVGKADYYTSTGECASITRKGGGAVIVKATGGGQVSVPNGGQYATPGNYTDHDSGGSFTVTADTITGNVGDSGIAVLYEGSEPDTSVQDTSTSTQQDTSTHQDTSTSVSGGSVNIYFDNSSYNWSSVYCYIYMDPSGENAKWPGVKLEKDSATGMFKYNADAYKNGFAIFSDGADGTSNRYPADMQPGMPIGGKSKIFGAGNSWADTDDSKQTTTESDKPSDTSTATTTDTGTSTDTGTTVDTSTTTEVDVLMGDSNQDGKINLRDASLALKAAVKKTTLTGKAFVAGDVDSNSQITAADSLAIQRYDIGYPSDTIGKSIKKAV